jgi:hypothetical protein
MTNAEILIAYRHSFKPKLSQTKAAQQWGLNERTWTLWEQGQAPDSPFLKFVVRQILEEVPPQELEKVNPGSPQ